jgi:hypothetical protein
MEQQNPVILPYPEPPLSNTFQYNPFICDFKNAWVSAAFNGNSLQNFVHLSFFPYPFISSAQRNLPIAILSVIDEVHELGSSSLSNFIHSSLNYVPEEQCETSGFFSS